MRTGAAATSRRSLWSKAAPLGNGLSVRFLGSFSRVDQIAKLFGWFEVGDTLCGNFHALASLGVSAYAGIALADTEGAKSTNFDFVAALQRGDD